MTYDDWLPIYKRLCKAKDRPADGEQGAALYDVLKDFPVPCVQQACYRAAREVSGWPKSDRLVELAQNERRKIMAPATACDVCHGEIWVEGPPLELGVLTYETVQRCPQCYA